MLRLTLIWTLCLLLFPILLLQGLWVKRRTPRLPEAAPRRDGESPLEVSVLGLGDSVIAGVGIDYDDNAITAQFARALSADLDQTLTWRAEGVNGDKIQDLIDKLPQLKTESAELVLISIGVNDVTALTSVTRWHLAVVQLISELKSRYQAPIVFMGVPPMQLFPALPQPLRFVLGIRAQMLDYALSQAGEVIDGVYHVKAPLPFAADLMASDGYHPGPLAMSEISNELVRSLKAQGLKLKS